MQFGKSLVGAVIGAIVGIAILVAINYAVLWDKFWLSIIVALCTGLGVRWMVATHGHPSYVRGALTAIIAMAAFFAYYPIMAQLRTRQSIAQPVVLERAAPNQGAAADDEPAEANATVEPVQMEERAPIGGAGARNPRPQEISAWDIISLCVAAFIAYELGRGSGGAKPTSDADSPDAGLPPQAAGQTAAPPN
jgi:hypothetical protein